MKVSIITVVYQNESTIEDAITSVLSQSYKDIEYIIIDGKSYDGTMDIIRKYEGQIACIISEEDSGIYDAMNKGIKMATGDIIGILNSDDVYANNSVVEIMVNEFKQNSKIDIVYGNLVYVKKSNTNTVVRCWKSIPYTSKFFEYGNVPPHPSTFLRKKVYELAGYFNLDFKLAADYEFLLRVFKKNIFLSKYIDLVVVKMRLGGATNKNIKNIYIQNKEIILSWRSNNFRVPLMLIPCRIIKRIAQFI